MEDESFENPRAPFFENSVDLRHYWHVILERRWLVITAFISVLVLAVIYLFRATRIYEAQAQIEIKSEAGNILDLAGLTFESRDQNYLQTQYKKLQSRSLLESVLADLNLDQDPRYAEALDPVRALAEDVTIAPIRLSRLVNVQARHPKPAMAAAIANTLAENFVEMNRLERSLASQDVAERLEKDAEGQAAEVAQAEQELEKYRQEKGIVSFEDSENTILQALKQYQSDFDAASEEAGRAEAIVRDIERRIDSGQSLYSVPQVVDNPQIQALLGQLAILRSQFDQLKERYKSKHPRYIEMQAQVLALEGELGDYATDLVYSIQAKAQQARAIQDQLKTLLKQKEAEHDRLESFRAEYNNLKRKAKEAADLYSAMLATIEARKMEGRNTVNNMQVVDEAVRPLTWVKPRVGLTLFLGLFGGLVLGVGLAFFVNFLDDSIKSQDDVESYLRLPFLGYIPNIKSNSVEERDLQAHLHPQSNAAEGFRTVRATISLAHKVNPVRAMVVTSTIPSEGKSLVASNLAVVTAQTGLRTLLVDADLRRPSVHKIFQLHSPVGLTSYLTEERSDLEGMVHKTEVPNLDVVCTGTVLGAPAELVSSKRMSEFVELAKTRYDRVLIDCPPVSAVSDPLLVAAMCDGVVFVTKFNKIRREHARKSVQRMQNAGIHIVGVVLNDIDFEGRDACYYSYYYYHNRYYTSHYQTGPEDVVVSSVSSEGRNGH